MIGERVLSFEQQEVAMLLHDGVPHFRASDVTRALGYKNSAQAIRKNVTQHYVKTMKQLCESSDESHSVVISTGDLGTSANLSSGLVCTESASAKTMRLLGKTPLYVTEAAVYELVWHSKKPEAIRFRQWIVEDVLPEIRRSGHFVRNQQLSLMNETDLHYKVVHVVRKYFPEAVMVAGFGELQDSSPKRIDAWSKGYVSGQPDLMLLNRTRSFSGLAIELKTPMCQRNPSPQQNAYLERLQESGFWTLVSNCYDEIVVNILEFREESRRLRRLRTRCVES